MFRVRGVNCENRQYHINLIRAVSEHDLGAAIILAAVYFEWCVRRCIMALGTSPVMELRATLNNKRTNIEALKSIWSAEVHKQGLPTLPSLFDSMERKPKFRNLTLDWKSINNAMKMRNRLVHGSNCNPKNENGSKYVELFLAATNILADLAESKGYSIFAIIRRKPKNAVASAAMQPKYK